MASKLECKKVGDTLTMHAMKVEVVESQIKDKNTGLPMEQVKFTDTRGDYLFLPRGTADRLLVDKCGFGERVDIGGGKVGYHVNYGDVDGHTLVFSRDPNKNPAMAPYWDLGRVDDTANRPPLAERAKAEAEKVRVAKGLPRDDGGSMGPYIPGLDPDPDDPGPTDPYAEDDGMPPVKVPSVSAPQKTLTAEQANKEGAINAAYARAYAFVFGVQGPVATPDSLQAGTATLLIQYSRAGIC
jgi:hypothetical protein